MSLPDILRDGRVTQSRDTDVPRKYLDTRLIHFVSAFFVYVMASKQVSGPLDGLLTVDHRWWTISAERRERREVRSLAQVSRWLA